MSPGTETLEELSGSATHVSRVVDALADVQLLIRQSRKKARDRPASSMPNTMPRDVKRPAQTSEHPHSPTAQRACEVSVRKSSRKRIPPALSSSSIASIDKRTTQRVDICAAPNTRGIHPIPDHLPRQIILLQTKLSVWHKCKPRFPTRWLRDRATRYIVRKSAQGLQRDILMWWPSIRSIPLQPRLNEGRGVSTIIASEHHVDTGEEAKRVG